MSAQDTDPERLLTKAEVADRLNVSPRTVERLVARGELVPLDIGAAVRFDPADVRQFLAASRRRARRRGMPMPQPSLRLLEGEDGRFADRVRSRRGG